MADKSGVTVAARQWGISSAGLRSSFKSPDKTRGRTGKRSREGKVIWPG